MVLSDFDRPPAYSQVSVGHIEHRTRNAPECSKDLECTDQSLICVEFEQVPVWIRLDGAVETDVCLRKAGVLGIMVSRHKLITLRRSV